jgi:hypothetical protein
MARKVTTRTTTAPALRAENDTEQGNLFQETVEQGKEAGTSVLGAIARGAQTGCKGSKVTAKGFSGLFSFINRGLDAADAWLDEKINGSK